MIQMQEMLYFWRFKLKLSPNISLHRSCTQHNWVKYKIFLFCASLLTFHSLESCCNTIASVTEISNVKRKKWVDLQKQAIKKMRFSKFHMPGPGLLMPFYLFCIPVVQGKTHIRNKRVQIELKSMILPQDGKFKSAESP